MKVSVIGSGTMGTGIVQILAQSETVSQVIWKGSSINKLEFALGNVLSAWSKLISKSKISDQDFDLLKEKIVLTDCYQDIEGSEYIIEAVSENYDVKKAVLLETTKWSGDAIIATNTSSLSITGLAIYIENPEKFIGLHFFNPAPVMKLTEVVTGMLTSDATLEATCQFALALGKQPVRVNEAPGFIVNRMLIPMINEAVGILAEGVASAEEIDDAMHLGANHPIGPLALADLIGNDVNLSIMETLYAETGDPKYRAHPLLRKMVRAGFLGRKSRKGFFDYQ